MGGSWSFQRRSGLFQDLRLGKEPLVIVAELVEKPGNLGVILRTADAAGVEGSDSVRSTVYLYGPKYSPCITGDGVHGADRGSEQCRGIGFSADTWNQNTRSDADGGDCLLSARYARRSGNYRRHGGRGAYGVLANERGCQGVNTDARQGDSLNVSIATALIVYEVVRQRSK